MISKEDKLEKKLGIHTKGRDASAETEHQRPYEPTAYEVLDKLASSEYMEGMTHLIDYGSGKGRVPIYLSWKCGIRATGIECNDSLYQLSVKNTESINVDVDVEFVLSHAETYQIQNSVDACFFFNPFSVEILKSVLSRLKESIYEHPRNIRLFFYYPSLEYVGYLMTESEIDYIDEIDCGDILRDGNAKECIMIFDLY